METVRHTLRLLREWWTGPPLTLLALDRHLPAFLSLDPEAPAGERMMNPPRVTTAVQLAHWLKTHPHSQVEKLERPYALEDPRMKR